MSKDVASAGAGHVSSTAEMRYAYKNFSPVIKDEISLYRRRYVCEDTAIQGLHLV